MSDSRQKHQKKSEWEKYGDPRCHEGHFRPKKNLGRYLRDDNNLSQKMLAEKLGTDGSTLSKWISGSRYLNDTNLVRIALTLHVSIAFILDMRKYGGEYSTSTGTSFGPELARVRAELRKREILYDLYWEILAIEDGELMTTQVDDDVFVTDIGYYDYMYPHEAYYDVEFDDYGRPYETRHYYSEAITVMERDNYDFPGDYREPNHILQALVKEYVHRGWGPNTLDRVAALVS